MNEAGRGELAKSDRKPARLGHLIVVQSGQVSWPTGSLLSLCFGRSSLLFETIHLWLSVRIG